MSKLAFYLPGNSFHSDISSKAAFDADREHLGLKEMAQTGIPVAVSFQKVDFEIYPWLNKELKEHETIEVIRSTFSHSLTPLLHKKQQRWEVSNMDMPGDDHPVMFHSEFYIPEASYLSRASAFLVLGAHTETYSYCYSKSGNSPAQIPWQLIDDVDTVSNHSAIQYGGKCGIVMKGFDSILRAFYQFLRDPYGVTEDGTATLVAAVDAVENTIVGGPDDEIVIVPIDIEAPYVGSLCGANIWTLYFNEIAKRGLSDACITLREVYEHVSKQSVKTKRPHRELSSKWTGYEAQWLHFAACQHFEPSRILSHELIALTTPSDVLSGLYRNIVSNSKDKCVNFTMKDSFGKSVTSHLLGDNGVVQIGHAARFAIENNRSLVDILEERHFVGVLLIDRVLKFAKRLGI